MTTIVFDGTTLAADTLGTNTKSKHFCKDCDKVINKQTRIKKILIVESGATYSNSKILAIAGAGHFKITSVITNILMNEEHPTKVINTINKYTKTFSEGYGIVVVLTEKGFHEMAIEDGSITYKRITKFPYAIGSGGKAALMAMKLQEVSPMEAIKLTSIIDEYTGKTVHYCTREDATNGKIHIYR